MTQTVAGIDSSFVVDGVSMTRNSNTVTDLYPGLSLELLKTSASPITIKSQVDLTKATEAIESYVLTYNDIFNSFEGNKYTWYTCNKEGKCNFANGWFVYYYDSIEEAESAREEFEACNKYEEL